MSHIRKRSFETTLSLSDFEAQIIYKSSYIYKNNYSLLSKGFMFKNNAIFNNNCDIYSKSIKVTS